MTREDFEHLHGFHGQVQTQPINVDDSDDDELALMIGHPAIHKEVQRYASFIAASRNARLDGDITLALRLEAKAESLYGTYIPKHLRW
jgi:hypothetical protein